MTPLSEHFTAVSRAVACTIIAVAAAASCSDPLDPSDRLVAGLNIVSGDGVTDSITALLSDRLVIRLLDEARAPRLGIEVRFESAPPFGSVPGALLSSGTQFSSSVAMTTDEMGEASVRVALGILAGVARVTVSVPSTNEVDTAYYTIRPGGPSRIFISPRDTAIALGASYALRAAVVDRFGNALSEQVNFQSVAEAPVSTSGVVTGTARGIYRVQLRANPGGTMLRDSATVAVLPDDRLVWSSVPGLNLMLGSMFDEGAQIVPGPIHAATWDPDGDRVVYNREGALWLNQIDGAATPLSVGGLADATWPEFSRDRGWIFFQAKPEFARHIYRVRPDGTHLEQLTTLPGEQFMPTPAPDGHAVAFIAGEFGAESLSVLDISTGATRLLSSGRVTLPRWSPDGQWIAFISDGQLSVLRPDGSDVRELGDVDRQYGITWSPDSRFLLAGDNEHMTIADLHTGAIAHLAKPGAYPAWSTIVP